VAAGEEGGAGAGSRCGSDHAEDTVEAGGGRSGVLWAQGETCEREGRCGSGRSALLLV
jgi:hypothetical protein